MTSKHTVLIVDDHQTFRESLVEMINRLSLFRIVGEAEDARQGEIAAGEHKPDIAVVDLSLPDKSGVQLTRIIRTQHPQTRVVIVSMHSKIDYILNALKAGALGYVVKESVGKHLQPAMLAAVKDNYYLDPALSQELAQKLLEIPGGDAISDTSYGDLTTREQEILRLLARGISTRDIAEKLCISPKTVNNHRTNIMGKLNLQTTVELIRYAGKLGLLDEFG